MNDSKEYFYLLLIIAGVVGFIWAQNNKGKSHAPSSQPSSVYSAPAPKVSAPTSTSSNYNYGGTTQRTLEPWTCPVCGNYYDGTYSEELLYCLNNHYVRPSDRYFQNDNEGGGTTPDDAYDEGYEQGFEDGSNGHRFDDSNDY